MTRQSRIPSTLAVLVVTCLTALALLVPAAPGARAAQNQGDCRLPAWTHVLTGHWIGGDCR